MQHKEGKVGMLIRATEHGGRYTKDVVYEILAVEGSGGKHFRIINDLDREWWVDPGAFEPSMADGWNSL